MEKVSRSSGGGAARLGTLDMQSYLEVMGRQLDEMQAQHHQFCASRPDRLGRLRSQEHAGHLVKRWSSESQCAPQQPTGLPPEYHPPDEGQAQQTSPRNDGGSGALRSSSGSQGGARRSLLFGIESCTSSPVGAAAAHRRTSPGKAVGTGVGPQTRDELRAFHSTPPPMAGMQDGADGGNPAVRGERPRTAAADRVQARATAPMLSDSPSVSESTSMTQSVTPSASSSKPQSDTPGTPFGHTGPRGATPLGTSRLGTVSSARTSPLRPYAVYDASGVGSMPYTTPDSREGDYPLTASISSSSQGVWHKSRRAAVSPSPSPGLSTAQGPVACPSTASGDSSPLADGSGLGAGAGNEVGSEDDCSPYTLALAGRPFDGIDSEEEEEEEEDNAQPVGLTGASGSGHVIGAAGVASAVSTYCALQPDSGEDSDQQAALLQAAPQPGPAAADPASPPHSRSGPRAPLVVASLETEEALRALLATPRFALSRSGTMGASVEGLEVPDDVLAALAKADGMDLDVALGAAMAGSLREQAAQDQQSGSPSTRSALQQQQQGLGGLVQTGHGRHMVLGPGALTAAPYAVPAAVAARGFDASVRSAGGAGGGRAAGGMGAASPQQPPPAVDASIEVDRFDMLSQTIEISTPGPGAGLSTAGLRDSVSVALAAQVAAAQQHSQPVLYSLAPKSSVPSDKGSRRNTLDGEGRRNTLDGGGGGRRNTVDGGSRRSTVDGGSALREYQDGGLVPGADQLNTRLHGAAPASVATAATAGGGSMRSELRMAGGSSSAVVTGSAHGAVAGSLGAQGRPSEGFAASASPVRGFRGSGNVASPSATSTIRPGGDGDMVLYGSPSQKADAGPSPSVAASPYVPPSPPPGADPTPYMASPTAPHIGSRLQRNSRKMDEEAVAGLQRDAVAECGQAPQGDAAGPSSGGAAALRPWSAAAGAQSSSRRQLTPTAASGASSGANSVHLDLSLTQAAAAAATGGGRQPALGGQPPSAGGSAAPSPAVSQRQLRPQGVQHLPALHKQQSEQPQGPPALEIPQLPAYSSFSLVGLSPPPRPMIKVTSHDLGVDEAGRPLPFLPSPKDTAAASSSAQLDPAGSSTPEGGRASRTQLQPMGPPLAAFARAAALAAAADVGLPAPLPAAERRPAPAVAPAAGVRATPSEGAAVAPPDSGSAAGGHVTAGADAQGGAEAAEDGNAGALVASQAHGLPKGAGAPSIHEDDAADVRYDFHDHPELLQGQSPGPQSVASSAAKLSQLKARRQQQWQSQHGLQGGQPPPAAAGTPPAQQSGAVRHDDEGSDAVREHGSSTVSGWAARPAARPAPGGNVGISGASEAAGTRSPLPAPVGSPLLPDAVAEAIARAASSKEEAVVSGELNLGHGISGLSVAIEAGQVKWAWQTDAKGKPAPGRLDTAADGPSSPGAGSGGSSPWASPGAAHAAVRDSGAEWALRQLPAPQWQRHGQLPAGAQEQKEEERAGARGPVLQTRQPGGNYLDARRRSEYSVAERQMAAAGAGGLQHNYAVSAGGFPTQEQHQPRVPSATDGGGQPNSKALALLRLKQQSIMRHNVQASSVKESGPQPDSSQQPQQAEQSAPQFQPYQRARASSAGTHQAAQQQQQQLLQRQPQRHLSASRAAHTGEVTEPTQQASRQWTQDADDGDAAGEDGAGSQAQPKPFLRRRSAKVQARKVDWSHVKPRTNSRNPDYYVDQNSPDAAQKGRGSPLNSPRGGISKPPLNVNVGTRAKKPGSAKPPLTPTEEDKAALAAPARRRLSNIPPGPAPGPAAPAGGAGEARRGAGVGGTRGAGGALSPLDDLLAHVNTLLKDFDRIVL